ncbi:hypothetical protein DSL72_000208 [Monilinia vaccinii-corymbosi]|uniref:Uncharacterized protein n=1 Tax=Monilinia vaccinii-corymbosi TaxID=61207 RepID=A0A8A3P2C7_9HELO|nr:hypothetical protein DSL72_000208 [Monilinia vaccinii-corymbosi]
MNQAAVSLLDDHRRRFRELKHDFEQTKDKFPYGGVAYVYALIRLERMEGAVTEFEAIVYSGEGSLTTKMLEFERDDFDIRVEAVTKALHKLYRACHDSEPARLSSMAEELSERYGKLSKTPNDLQRVLSSSMMATDHFIFGTKNLQSLIKERLGLLKSSAFAGIYGIKLESSFESLHTWFHQTDNWRKDSKNDESNIRNLMLQVLIHTELLLIKVVPRSVNINKKKVTSRLKEVCLKEAYMKEMTALYGTNRDQFMSVDSDAINHHLSSLDELFVALHLNPRH